MELATSDDTDQMVCNEPDGGIYEVDQIIGYRYNKEKRRNEYLVHWKGFSSASDTWEAMENLTSCSGKLMDFLNRVKEKAGERVESKDDSSSESNDDDLMMSAEHDTHEKREERVFPDIENSGMSFGWRPKRIIGWRYKQRPHTYLVEYAHKKQVEHLPTRYVARRYPKLVQRFHAATNTHNPYASQYD